MATVKDIFLKFSWSIFLVSASKDFVVVEKWSVGNEIVHGLFILSVSTSVTALPKNGCQLARMFFSVVLP